MATLSLVLKILGVGAVATPVATLGVIHKDKIVDFFGANDSSSKDNSETPSERENDQELNETTPQDAQESDSREKIDSQEVLPPTEESKDPKITDPSEDTSEVKDQPKTEDVDSQGNDQNPETQIQSEEGDSGKSKDEQTDPSDPQHKIN